MKNNSRNADTMLGWSSALEASAPARFDSRRASDNRRTSQIIAAYLQTSDELEACDLLATVQYRGGHEELHTGVSLLNSSDPRERIAGAAILGQLGWQDRTFLKESVDALLCALRDPDSQVVESALFALGHRADPRALDELLRFVDYPSADMRYASVRALMPHDTPRVVDALAKLSRDSDRDVRNWATFALGSQLESSSPPLRAALLERLTDEDPEIRGEALLGLARRGETSIVSALQRELDGELHGEWAAEAAASLGDPRLLPALRRLHARLECQDAAGFRSTVQSAITACEGKLGGGTLTLQ